jgi:hypothetical protein
MMIFESGSKASAKSKPHGFTQRFFSTSLADTAKPFSTGI